jgi:hypothetical protein
VSRVVNLPISVALLALLVAVSLASTESTKGKAKLVLVGTNPVVVAGLGFERAERVTLRTRLDGRRITKHVTAGRTGRFRVLLAATNAECDSFSVSAIGREGSRATAARTGIPAPCGIVIAP